MKESSLTGRVLTFFCSLLLSGFIQAAEPVASSDGVLTQPTVVDFGELSEDSTYVFFFNAIKGGTSTAVAGDNIWGLKLEQWRDTMLIGTTEFGVADHVFEPDGSGSPDALFEEDVHLAFVNDYTYGEVLIYVNGILSGYLIGNFELSGEAKVMAARISQDTDAMGEGSVLYSWAAYDETLSADEILALAEAAEPIEPAEPVAPVDPVDPLAVVASSYYAPLHPVVVDFGALSGDASYEFFFHALKAGVSTAIAGNDAIALKLDQWNEQGVFGLTEFGVADHVFDPMGEGATASIFEQDVHVVIVNDATQAETRLYVDGGYAGVLGANFELSGLGKVMATRIEQDTDPMGDGSVMYAWATYNAALPEDFIAELAASAKPFDPSGPFTQPTVVDFGPVEEDASYEFFFNAIKGGTSTAIAGNNAWGLKLEQWSDTQTIGVTEFGVLDNIFEIEGNGSDEALFGEDLHVVYVNDVTLGEVRLYVNGEYVGYISGNFDLSGPSKVMAARIEENTDPMGDGSVLYFWDVRPGVLTEDEIASLYQNAEPREPTEAEPVDPVEPDDPNLPPVPDGALIEPTVVDFGDILGDATYEFSFHAFKAGASTAIAGNDAWGLKLDQWNEQGVFGITEFGVVDSVFQADGPGSAESVFEEDVHVVFVNDVTMGETRLYVNGLYAGFTEGIFELSGEGKVMAARIEQNTDPMGDGSVMYGWSVHAGILSEEEIAALVEDSRRAPGGITGITRASNGTFIIEFTGSLEAASSVEGPYTPVQGASSPYGVTSSGDAMFYIAR